jgi:hypothetical protein
MSWGKDMLAALDAKPTYNWQPIADAGGYLVPEGEEVWTKIADDHGERNIAKLTRHGSLWWINGHEMYVYYTPTHWHR